MVLVVVGLGEQAGGVLGAEVDLEEPVVLVALCCGGDGFEVRFEPAARAVGKDPGSPADRFGADQGQVSVVGLGGFRTAAREQQVVWCWAVRVSWGWVSGAVVDGAAAGRAAGRPTRLRRGVVMGFSGWSFLLCLLVFCR